ncbi:formyl-CoA transferase [Tistlia consotensis]|uniref:Formyl-CoA transferase n=1 Tax=Tistlia consotensis USBA 355 TaxID=560819 RepID=A0A1Y6CEJ6_9PROT|nr:CoA transferase [Tistlia consotensis]SMF57076.1 formyl-CoA transferase [Tistlia consotensis USBA 355]SNR45318.1 formyl-CoA transferase [Tistlia consotensis]
MASETPVRPLDGCKVLDLTAIVLGPLATLCLADLGAEVVKVEPPEGDSIRNGGSLKQPGMGSIYLALNRNKKSLAIDLKRPEAKAVIARLAAWADVVVHNMLPAAARRLGVDYESLAAVNPRLVYCAASGFAEGSPRAGEPAVDDVIQAASGIAALFAGPDSEPRYVPTLVADKVSGLLVCQAVLAALLAREKTGRGQAIYLSMFEAMAGFTLLEHLGGASFLPPQGPPGYGRLTTPYRRPMRTRDGYLSITPYTKRHWQQFFAAAGRPELGDDPRVTDAKRRNEEIGDLYAVLSGLLVERTTDEWMALSRRVGIPASPVHRLEDLVASGPLRDQGCLVPLAHPTLGDTLTVGPLVRLEGMAAADLRPAPALGQDSGAVLRQLGFSERQIGEWRSDGLVVEPAAPAPAS